MTEKENDKLWDSYFYPGTDILINNFNVKDFEKLKELEMEYSFKRLIELRNNPVKVDLDSKYLKLIHKYILGDIYPFAGQYRKVNMIKKIGTFLKIENNDTIENYLTILFNSTKEQLNKCDNKFQFSEILARLYTNLIYCHPFRDENEPLVKNKLLFSN